MAGAAVDIEWYLGRDGQQYGPLRDEEVRKLHELGHLRAEDLIWRVGFAEWRPALDVFAPQNAVTASVAEPPPDPEPEPEPEPTPRPEIDPPAAQSSYSARQEPEPQPYAPQPADPVGPEPDPQAAVTSLLGQETDTRWPVVDNLPNANPASVTTSTAAQPAWTGTWPSDGRIEPRMEPAPTVAAPATMAGPDTIARDEAWRDGPRIATLAPGLDLMHPGQLSRDATGPAADPNRAGPAFDPAAYRPGEQAPMGTPQPDREPRPRKKKKSRAKPGHASAPRRVRRIAAVVLTPVLLIALAVGGYVYWDSVAQVMARAGRTFSSLVGGGSGANASFDPKTSTAARIEKVALPAGAGEVWSRIQSDFPEWHAERMREVARLRAERKDDKAVLRYLSEAAVALRRNYASDATVASPERIRKIATAFVDSLSALRQHSIDSCYNFISHGEANPIVMQAAEKASVGKVLDEQLRAVFDAIGEGRRSPVTHLPPRKGDYDMLADELVRRGWSDNDLQVFADPRQLARASPDRVCRMVLDWFAAHLSIQDPNVQTRLLIESLKPVVAG